MVRAAAYVGMGLMPAAAAAGMAAGYGQSCRSSTFPPRPLLAGAFVLSRQTPRCLLPPPLLKHHFPAGSYLHNLC